MKSDSNFIENYINDLKCITKNVQTRGKFISQTSTANLY